MNIELAKQEDALEIARIHKAEINKGFLSTLSDSFLKNLYLAIIDSKENFCVVAKENGRVIGFVSGVSDLDAFYSHFFRKYFFKSFFILFKKFFSISFIVKAFETLLYPVKEKVTAVGGIPQNAVKLPKAELLTMAVRSEFHGQGIASKMFVEFINEMKKRNIASLKVLVGEDLKPAIAFYEKVGFTFLRNTKVHGKSSSRIYILDL